MSSLLRTRMIEDLRIRNYSQRTIECYVSQVARFADYYRCSPEKLGGEHVRGYQRFLVEERKASWSAFNQAVCALRFVYRVTLGGAVTVEQIPYAKREQRLPEVLSAKELGRFFCQVKNPKYRVIVKTMYSSGLRLSEALHLKADDIDSERMVVRVRQGKGRKDRYVELTPSLLAELRDYWREYRPKTWLFEGESKKFPLTPSAVQKTCRLAALKAGLKKRVTTQTMRHCYATHQLEAGANLRTLQLRLGHSSLNTTALYLHVAAGASQTKREVVDLLENVSEADELK